tara:strand:+ start:1502 stop:2038 length:537 start_codon:yes stop_codon:yes gene_type:complete
MDEYTNLAISSFLCQMNTRVNKAVYNFILRDYEHLKMLRKAIEIILDEDIERPQISVLGKLGNNLDAKGNWDFDQESELNAYWNKVLKEKVNFGVFPHTEFESLFIAGALASQFLFDISGRPLGSMSAGPYGILRGLGITEDKVNFYLKALKKGHLLLLVRHTFQQTQLIEEKLEKLG